MKRLDPSFTDNEVECIFRIIDQDNSNTIEFDELNSYFSRINGLPESMNLPPEYYSMKKRSGHV